MFRISINAGDKSMARISMDDIKFSGSFLVRGENPAETIKKMIESQLVVAINKIQIKFDDHQPKGECEFKEDHKDLILFHNIQEGEDVVNWDRSRKS